MTDNPFAALDSYREYPVDEMRQRAHEFYEEVRRRRSVRGFSDRPPPREVIEDCTAPRARLPAARTSNPGISWSLEPHHEATDS